MQPQIKAKDIFWALFETNRMIQRKHNRNGDVFDRLPAVLKTIFTVDVFSIFQFDYEKRRLRLRFLYGQPSNLLDAVNFQLGKGAVRWVIDRHKALLIPDAQRRPLPQRSQKVVNSFLGVPIIVNGYLIGAVIIGSFAPNSYDKRDQAVLELFGSLIGSLLLKNQWIEDKIKMEIRI
ncbi:MAG: GAF domain-containing protein [Calditrichaeota bacterium]|nr:GAF domain-containing protein [Calditrichota bacterium]